jgi:5-methylcytosine-specific restriction endonuclease McrA
MDDETILTRKLIEAGKFTKHPRAPVIVGAHFRCEYCGLDFLASAVNHTLLHWDHIIPKSKKPDNSVNNRAAACWTCNKLKGKFDPRTTAGKNASRSELIEAAKKKIAQGIKNNERYIREIKDIVATAARPQQPATIIQPLHPAPVV